MSESMHEFSLVESLLDEVERVGVTRPGVMILEITIDCGPLSGVEPELLHLAFESLAPPRLGENCRLRINDIPLEATCRDCHSLCFPSLGDIRCHVCGSRQVNITQGDGLILRSITLSEENDHLPP
jgi:hydrogenase nickel incorporation protein HypA/HybF